MIVGFIGLGNVGGKLCGSLLRNGIKVQVYDLDPELVAAKLVNGADNGVSPARMMQRCDAVITCLPSPAASAAVMAEMMPHVTSGKIWMEMSTTDESEVKRIGAEVISSGGFAVDCPVSGGCHRAGTGNISIYAGCDRATFDKIIPLLSTMGRRVLHTGPLGSASILKVMTNYLATANLLTLCEALTVMKGAGMDLATTFEAISISSGTSFVHETESQLILSGSRDVNFSMDLVQKDIGLFQKLADTQGIHLEISPLMIEMMRDGQQRFGERAQSDRMIERLELVDEEPEEPGYEVRPMR